MKNIRKGQIVRAWLRLVAAGVVLVAAVLMAGEVGRGWAQGVDDIEVLNRQANQLWREGKYREATEFSERALKLATLVLGAEHPETLGTAIGLATLYTHLGRYDEAELILKRIRVASERVLGRTHPRTLTIINNLAVVYRYQGRYSEAEPLYKLALQISEEVNGKEDTDTLASVNNLAVLYQLQGRYGEAEPLLLRVVETIERVLGLAHPLTLLSVNNLAALYHMQGRHDEAEVLFKRAQEGFEQVLPAEHPYTLGNINNLAYLYLEQGRYDKAEPLLERAVEIRKRVSGLEHPDTLLSIQNLAMVYLLQGRYDDAEPLNELALKTNERILGWEHPQTLASVNALAMLYQDQGRYGDALPLYMRAVEVGERILGKEHPVVAFLYNGNLATLHFEQGNWPAATRLLQHGTRAIARLSRRQTNNVGHKLAGKQPSMLKQTNWSFQLLVKALYRQVLNSELSETEGQQAEQLMDELMNGPFMTAQWALGSEAAHSLAQMAARGAKGDSDLAVVVRERQDLVGEWQALDERRGEFLARPSDQRHAPAEAAIRDRLAAIETRITEIDKDLTERYPDYAAFANPEPLSITDVQSRLTENEALVLFFDTSELFGAGEETFIWAITRTDAKWLRTSLGTTSLTREVRALRCGLDEEEWATPTDARRCADLLGLTEAPDASRPLPFDLGKAHTLYRALFGQIEDIIAGKRLLVVPSGALASLPFHVLVTKAPGTAPPNTFEGYRNVAWLGRTNAITTLPAVSSLKALRQHASDRAVAADAYAGYGNPLLSGDGGSCRAAKSPEVCPEIDVAVRPGSSLAVETTGSTETARATVRGRGGRRSGNATTDEVFAKGSTPEALLTQVRGLCPLPDTEYEIKCVAKRFAAKASLIRLADEARETDIKALSEDGKLAQYRVLHFATHGLLSGDVERMAQRQGEPALVLTPPDKPANAEDDGLLMASEVAALKLNADWVVMSACNTAAGDKIGAQALSGLARAFFYAGGRALLVSHWPVYSDAAVRLTTSAFAELDRNPKAGRAEALQNAMTDLMDDRSQADNAHPAVWAPFVVVGEGGR